uniref:WGS project CBMI000000000 data, contig CS3069_c004530 n=1 Tax=Fusarium clavum TaxID=2594811 RepID=A0A090MKK4_9HYPO|nr:unnamed protein product [Fusarium clavum]
MARLLLAFSHYSALSFSSCLSSHASHRKIHATQPKFTTHQHNDILFTPGKETNKTKTKKTYSCLSTTRISAALSAMLGRMSRSMDSNARCHKCRSPGHLIADCPYKDESRRECRKRLREAASAQEVLPAPQVATELEMLNDEQRAVEERLIEIRRRRQQLLQQLQANTEPAVKEEEQDQD